MFTAGNGPLGGLVAPGAPGLMKRTRWASLPLIVNWFAPGPAMVTLLETSNWPLVKMMVPESKDEQRDLRALKDGEELSPSPSRER